jgi:pimeloyl-ACP methyl ester carboxylesterase
MTGSRSCGGAGRGTRRGVGMPVTVTQRQVRLHGQHVTHLEAGVHGGPVVLLLHGLASSSATWADVMSLLGRSAHVIAPDLLGHGDSAKPRSGDYSLGAHAAGLRDLLAFLDLERATVVGHSFGGGVALQFAYQHPELTERVVLVASGGLGQGVNLALRAATLPGASTALKVVTAATPRWLATATSRVARAVPVLAGADLEGLLSAFASFGDGGARDAFVQSVRGALDLSGQRLTGTERLHLLAETPVLLVAGSRDPMIPVDHTVDAHETLPGSRLELFDGAGHFPHIDDPRRFTHLVHEFVASTEPAHADRHSLRRHLQETR